MKVFLTLFVVLLGFVSQVHAQKTASDVSGIVFKEKLEALQVLKSVNDTKDSGVVTTNLTSSNMPLSGVLYLEVAGRIEAGEDVSIAVVTGYNNIIASNQWGVDESEASFNELIELLKQ